MTHDQRELLEAARQSLSAAKYLLDGGYVPYATARAYYCMFYAAEALLEGEEMSFSKHSAVIAAFGRHFARTGKVPRELHRHLLEAEQLRHVADYLPQRDVTPQEASEQISRAQVFLETAEGLCSSKPASSG